VPVAGSVEYIDRDGTSTTLALLQAYTVNQGDAWTHTVETLVRHLEACRGADADTAPGIEGFLTLVQTLGIRTAQLHAALSRRTGDDAFDPEPLSDTDIGGWVRQVRDDLLPTMNLLSARRDQLRPGLQERAQQLFAAGPRLMQQVERYAVLRPSGFRTRHHGDYHLGQVLIASNDFVIIDFEGEPARPLAERRRKHLALRDVAGMLRSFDYARHAALAQVADDGGGLAGRAGEWLAATRRTFVDAYRDEAIRCGLYGDAAAFEALAPLVELFELEKALYELRYELNNRPDWAGVPLEGIAALAGL
jgi:maltose alpha-D-glucosyltransferase/alpha-amylase